jgi:hypothetical protein
MNTNTSTFFHGFDFAGWQFCYERFNGGSVPKPFFAMGGTWRDFVICIGRWRVEVGHDGLTRAQRKRSKARDAAGAWSCEAVD